MKGLFVGCNGIVLLYVQIRFEKIYTIGTIRDNIDEVIP